MSVAGEITPESVRPAGRFVLARGARLFWLPLAAVLAVFTGLPVLTTAATNPIVVENQQPGTDNWQIPNAGYQQADDISNQIKGYASAPSVNKGANLTFYVTVNPAGTFSMDIYRMGWYGGLGGRLITSTGLVGGVSQPACPTVDNATLLLACNWSPSYTLAVPTTWTDGVYLAVLSSTVGSYQNYVPFVVRDDSRQAGLLYQQPVNTYQAYNSWGGKSLYTYNSTNSTRAYKVSFDRPYSDDGSADYFGWEVYLVQWLEQNGYDVTYATDVDVATNPSRMRSTKGLLVAGHNEYWSASMYDAVQGARDAGVSLAVFGSNDAYWQVRYESSGSGKANRVLVCYKTSDAPNPVDPISVSNPALTTTQWRQSPVNRPEQTLFGVQFTSQTGNTWDNTVPYVVSNSGHWAYSGTGFSDGSSVAGIAGYEADRVFNEFPQPSNQASSLLSRSPYTSVTGASDYQNAVVYKALSGAYVFASGTEAWSWGLSRPGFQNSGIQQTTRNILNTFLSNVPVPATPTPTPTPVTSAYRSAILADNPLGYWRLGEASGTVAADQRGASNGTYTFNPALGRLGALSGDVDTAVAFDGTSQYVQIPSTPSLNPATFSAEIWARPTSGAGAYRGVLASRFYPTGWVLYAGGGGAWEFWVNSGSAIVSVAGGTVTPNTWQHVVGTFDGTTARLYVNGVAVASGAVPGYQPQTRNPIEIGQSEPGSNFYFPGSLDEPAIYGAALSPSQVQRHYSVGTTGR